MVSAWFRKAQSVLSGSSTDQGSAQARMFRKECLTAEVLPKTGDATHEMISFISKAQQALLLLFLLFLLLDLLCGLWRLDGFRGNCWWLFPFSCHGGMEALILGDNVVERFCLICRRVCR